MSENFLMTAVETARKNPLRMNILVYEIFNVSAVN